MGALSGYHAHVYYDVAERAKAADLRAEIGRRFPVVIGRMHDQPVGPHTRSMFQVAFGQAVFAELLPWLMLNRQGLSVLVHPETGNAVADHQRHMLWLGEPLAIDADAL